MKLILLPRGYEVFGHSFSSYAEAQACAANNSDHQRNVACNVLRDPLVKDGVEIEGIASVSCWLNGKQVFPAPISKPNCLWSDSDEQDYLLELRRQDRLNPIP